LSKQPSVLDVTVDQELRQENDSVPQSPLLSIVADNQARQGNLARAVPVYDRAAGLAKADPQRSFRPVIGPVRTFQLQQQFHRVIPGGSHTYAKGDDQYPEQFPLYIDRGSGCRVWDVEGREFIEYNMGVRAVTLGHAYQPVVEAAVRAMRQGSNFVRPARIELECAEALRQLIPRAEMVKFGKDGSDVTTAAVKLARAYTGRDMIAICGNHPFFSTDDWFIGSTPMAGGIPESVRALTVKFQYNNLASVEALFQQYPSRIACVILEAEKEDPPVDGFLNKLKELCHRHGIVFILDEIITGFRWHLNGAQTLHGVDPDLSTFGKGFGNGFSVSALAGKREIMELGGLFHQQERVFLLSATHGAETHGLAAALEVMRIYQSEPVIETLYKQGELLRTGVNQLVAELGLEGYFEVLGRPCCLVYATRDAEKKPSQAFRTLFLQEIFKRGLLAPSFVVSYSHGDAEIDQTVSIVGEALEVYRRALEDGVEKHLVGRAVKPVWRSRN
jgi:glutamate-1-semialdehyde 2,1-aminomutase